jgi:hypothetical protein
MVEISNDIPAYTIYNNTLLLSKNKRGIRIAPHPVTNRMATKSHLYILRSFEPFWEKNLFRLCTRVIAILLAIELAKGIVIKKTTTVSHSGSRLIA